MATLLFAYEFGAGLGHLGILSTIAKRFVGQHRIVFAAPDLPLATAYLSQSLGRAAVLHQAPAWSGVKAVIEERGTHCHTLAETLTLFGFDDPHRLRAACEVWSNMIRDEKPDLVIVDSAPTARLALEARVPMIVVGTGYTVLPGGRAMPALRPWQPLVPPRSRAVEARICAAVNDLRAEAKGRAVDHVGDLFRGDRTFVSTLPEFDPYARFRGPDPYVPFAVPDFQSGPSFDLRTGPPVFAYLPSVHPAVLPVIAALNDLDVPSRLYLSNAHPEKVASLCRRHVRVHAAPADFSAVLPQTRVVIHHAGLGTTLAAMATGTAQLTLPAMLENQVTGSGLEGSGSSINVPMPSDRVEAEISEGLGRLMNEARFERAASVGADRIARIRDADPLAHVVEAISDLLH